MEKDFNYFKTEFEKLEAKIKLKEMELVKNRTLKETIIKNLKTTHNITEDEIDQTIIELKETITKNQKLLDDNLVKIKGQMEVLEKALNE